MSCCKKNIEPENHCKNNCNNGYFIILILFILLAVIIGGVGY